MILRTSVISREQGATRVKRVRLTCPSCGYRVGDASLQSCLTIRLAENDTKEPADLYIKCGRCKAEIAVQKTK